MNPDILAISEVPLVSAVDIDINKFIPNDREVEVYKDSLKILLGRIMAEYVPGFQLSSVQIELDFVSSCGSPSSAFYKPSLQS